MLFFVCVFSFFFFFFLNAVLVKLEIVQFLTWHKLPGANTALLRLHVRGVHRPKQKGFTQQSFHPPTPPPQSYKLECPIVYAGLESATPSARTGPR